MRVPKAANYYISTTLQTENLNKMPESVGETMSVNQDTVKNVQRVHHTR